MAEQVKLRIDSIDGLIGAIPRLIGFEPEESLVFVALRGGRVVVTARIDLVDLFDTTQVSAMLAHVWASVAPEAVVVMAYTDAATVGWDAVQHVADWAQAHGTDVYQAAVVSNGMVHETVTDAGRPIGGDALTVEAEAVGLGMGKLPTRAALARTVEAPPSEAQRALAAASKAAAATIISSKDTYLTGRLQELIDGFDPSTTISDSDAALAGILARTGACREHVILTLNRDNTEEVQAFWSAVARRNLPIGRLFPLLLTGMAAWVAGNGALASICLERVETETGTRPALYTILSSLVVGAVNPAGWETIRSQWTN